MPRPKQFLKDTKKKSKQTPKVCLSKVAPQLTRKAGVDLEDAGEKWRAGDAAKSTRFFLRAINNYDEALKKFPEAFDLAYNRARVQFELTQYPKLLAQLPETLIDLLRTALESSRLALRLQQDNVDALFNTAQVLAGLAEAFSENPSAVRDDREVPLRLLEEAMELFQRCLSLQEYRYSESQTAQQMAEQPNSMSGEELAADEALASGETTEVDHWAVVVEPITKETLLDTVLAQLEAMTLLCQVINPEESRLLAWTEEFSMPLIKEKLPAYAINTDRSIEAALAKANFAVALADANFRTGQVDVTTYERVLRESYENIDLSQTPEGLCEKAEALMSYDSSLRLNITVGNQPDVLVTRWGALTTALECLAAASKLPSADNLEKIHLTRGDAEMLRFQLSQPPSSHGVAMRNGPTLLKNAATYYRGSNTLAKAAGLSKASAEASVKEALAMAVGGDSARLAELVQVERDYAQEVLQDAVEDGLVSVDWLVSSGIAQV